MKLIALCPRILAFLPAWLAVGLACASPVVPPTEWVSGANQAEWSVRWWQWAWSFPEDESPVADRTGQACASKQAGDVWFLAGTYGTRRTIRRCTVPAGKYIFFPLINYVFYPPRGVTDTCNSMKASAARQTDGPLALVLEVGAERVAVSEAHRQVSGRCFDLGARMEPPSRIHPAASDGYYVMLKPLPKGTHVINFGGILPSLSQAVTYTLTVE